MIPQPLRISGFIYCVFGKREHSGNHFSLLRFYAVAVQSKEDGASHKRDALVAIDKTMVLGEPGSIGRSQVKNIRISEMQEVPGPVQCGLDGAAITDPVRSAKFGYGVVMELEDCAQMNPVRFGQRASSRMAGA